MTDGYKDQILDWSTVKYSEFFSEQIYLHPLGKPLPKGVPGNLLEDYKEVWAIINLSPKSSATLARRCLQSIIWDFCGIKDQTRFEEIKRREEHLVNDTSFLAV